MIQTLVLPDFPPPAIARALSPNGRAHWAARGQARRAVEQAVWLAACGGTGRLPLRPMTGLVTIQFTYTYSQQRRRDADNLSGSGCCKVIIDSLVRLGILVDDDLDHLRQAPVQVRVVKGMRQLEITLESAE